jgi:aspartyl/asparaginyl-tRNA synthetase
MSSIVCHKGTEICWRGQYFYLNFKYPSDHGVICTLDNPVYPTRIKGKTIHRLDRSARPRTISFDPTEYRFKLALLRHNHEEVLHIIRTSTLLGQSIIAYLQQKGFPEVRHPRLLITTLTS